MAQNFLTLLICQVIGELVHRIAGLPLSGPIIGMVILLSWMIVRGGPSTGLRSSADSLLQYLSLLFVPAAVGVIAYMPVLQRQWLPITVALFASTILGMGAAALTMQAVNRRHLSRPRKPIGLQVGELGDGE
ncbi:MAG TPA: CidA/LrgA family protein [Sphingomicrobium sp.]|nr:CidA/LrgA family protein [Sphingomicrobium sp.]